MESIISNLQDITYWFTCLFYLLIGYIVKISATSIPKFNKNMKARRRLKVLKILKSHRQHDMKIQWLICRYWAMGTITMGLMISSGFVLTVTPNIFKDLASLLFPTVMFVASYISIFQLAREKELITELIKINIEWKKKHNRDRTPHY